MPPKKGKEFNKEDVLLLKNKLSSLESQLKEANKTNQRLKSESEKKLKKIEDLEEEKIRQIEEYKWRKAEYQSNILEVTTSSEKILEEISEEVQELEIQLVGHEDIEYNNETLQRRLKKLADDYYTTSEALHAEKEMRKQHDFELSMKMDQILRNTITGFNADYEIKAIENMREEAKLAALDNERLIAEFNNREDLCQKLVREQQKSYEKVSKLRLQLEVVSTTANIQENSAVELVFEQEDREIKLAILRDMVNNIREEVRMLNIQTNYKNSLKETYAVCKDDVVDLKKKSSFVMNTVIALSNKFIEESLIISDQCQNNNTDGLLEAFSEMFKNDGGVPLEIVKKKSRGSSHAHNRKGKSPHSTNSSRSVSLISPINNKEYSHESFFEDKYNDSFDCSEKFKVLNSMSQFDPDQVWNINRSNDCNVMSSPLRKFLRQQRREFEKNQ